MKISVGKHVGNDYLVFETEGNDLKDALEKASKFTDSTRKGNLPETCGLCGGKNLCLTSYRTKEKNFLYVKLVCRSSADCGGFSELGQNTKTGDFYWKPFEKYVPQSQPVPREAKPDIPTEDEPIEPDDIPF